MIIVSDISPISNLILISKLQILQSLFKTVIIPPAVDKEIKAMKLIGYDISSYEKADWIITRQLVDKKTLALLKLKIDSGEAEAIALAMEINCDLILIEERLGSTIAKQENLKTIGLAGVLVLAKERGLINELKPILSELKMKAGFWLGEKLVLQILIDNGEA